MKTVRVTIDPNKPASVALGRIDAARVDGATEQNMSPEEQQKMLQEMMKMYQGQMPAEKP